MLMFCSVWFVLFRLQKASSAATWPSWNIMSKIRSSSGFSNPQQPSTAQAPCPDCTFDNRRSKPDQKSPSECRCSRRKTSSAWSQNWPKFGTHPNHSLYSLIQILWQTATVPGRRSAPHVPESATNRHWSLHPPLPSPDFLEPAQVHLAKVIVQRAQVSTTQYKYSRSFNFSGKTRQHFALYSHRIPACEIVTTVLHTPLLLAQLHLFAEWQTKLMKLQPQLSSAVNQVICRTRFSSSILVRSSCTCSPDSRRILLPKDSGLFQRTPRRHPQLVRSVEDMMIRRLSDSFSGFPWVSWLLKVCLLLPHCWGPLAAKLPKTS